MPSRTISFNLYRHGFARMAVRRAGAHPAIPRHNVDATLELMRQAARDKALLAVFPELGLSRTAARTFFTSAPCSTRGKRARAAPARTRSLPLAALVGCRSRSTGRLYNCAALVCRGRLVGVVPKTYRPNYREFYEAAPVHARRQRPARRDHAAGQDAAFGTNLLFRLAEMPSFVLHVEICEDQWVPAPPSSFAALAGATVFGNLSHRTSSSAREGYRHQLVSNQSARCIAAYLYSGAVSASHHRSAWDATR